MPDRLAEPVRLLTSRVLAAGEVPPSVLHVQSISDWAPACIGPYAQAVAARGLLHMAGQIPLEPGSMQIEQQGLLAQARAPLCYSWHPVLCWHLWCVSRVLHWMLMVFGHRLELSSGGMLPQCLDECVCSSLPLQLKQEQSCRFLSTSTRQQLCAAGAMLAQLPGCGCGAAEPTAPLHAALHHLPC